jgi:hypothetical protein
MRLALPFTSRFTRLWRRPLNARKRWVPNFATDPVAHVGNISTKIMAKNTIIIEWQGEGLPPVLTKEQIRAIKIAFVADSELEIISNRGFEVHSQEMTRGKFEGVKLTKQFKWS